MKTIIHEVKPIGRLSIRITNLLIKNIRDITSDIVNYQIQFSFHMRDNELCDFSHV